MNDINKVRQDAIKVFDGLFNGTIEVALGEVLNNSIRGIVSTVALEVKYAEMREKRPNTATVPFMHYEATDGK